MSLIYDFQNVRQVDNSEILRNKRGESLETRFTHRFAIEIVRLCLKQNLMPRRDVDFYGGIVGQFDVKKKLTSEQMFYIQRAALLFARSHRDVIETVLNIVPSVKSKPKKKKHFVSEPLGTNHFPLTLTELSEW